MQRCTRWIATKLRNFADRIAGQTTLAQKPHFEDDEPKPAMYFYKEIALLMANDVIAIDKQTTALRKFNQLCL